MDYPWKIIFYSTTDCDCFNSYDSVYTLFTVDYLKAYPMKKCEIRRLFKIIVDKYAAL